jgi:hypothetical protein
MYIVYRCVPQTVKLQIKTWRNEKKYLLFLLSPYNTYDGKIVLGVKCSHDNCMHFWIAKF